ncbi:GNAT family N-acetyltransferase [Flavobacterium sp. '19STA2R22 D10 B1']|uniref:GNAT family N-acetyltransferase n=1 Tax=Flavobacterium aerium TaxID=3037261 RepID=UPI00278C1918|nr:GNAT family protein [Flavobacterium sp. '19STA2R22 D10 B1']
MTLEKINILTERLLIRILKREDLEDFHFYRSNPEVTKYQGFDVMTQEECLAFITNQEGLLFGKVGEWIQYGLEDITTGKIVGDCAIKLDQYDVRIAEVGITISHTEQRKGYAKETFHAILSFLFDQKELHRVVEIVDAENAASIQLLKSTGFRQEGHFIENIFFKGKWGSEFQYALLKKEWDATKQQLLLTI